MDYCFNRATPCLACQNHGYECIGMLNLGSLQDSQWADWNNTMLYSPRIGQSNGSLLASFRTYSVAMALVAGELLQRWCHTLSSLPELGMTVHGRTKPCIPRQSVSNLEQHDAA